MCNATRNRRILSGVLVTPCADEPIAATDAAVAAVHPLATRAAVDVLRDGGNA